MGYILDVSTRGISTGDVASIILCTYGVNSESVSNNPSK